MTVAAAPELVDAALAASKADDCIVLATDQTEANLRWANNSLTTNGQMTSRSVTVISFVRSGDDVRVGVVTRAVSTLDELGPLVVDSEAAAHDASPADDAMPLLTPSDVGTVGTPWDAPAATTSVGVFAAFAPALGAAFVEAAELGHLWYGFAEHTVTSTYLGSSTGLRLRHDQPTGRVEINAKTLDLTGSAWVGVHTVDFADVAVPALSAELSKRLGWSSNRIDLPAGRYETLLPPGAVADLLVYAYWNGSARDAEEGRNVYAAGDGRTKIGRALSELPLDLWSDPAAAGIECEPFVTAASSSGGTSSVFDNGLPIPRTDWIHGGKLTNLIRTRQWGAKTSEPARPAVDNLLFDGGGTATLDEMISRTRRGLLLTCLWYIREVDPQTLLLTGLTRDGVYLIENGHVVGAVNNFRFNESPVDLLGRITEVGRAEHVLPREWNDYFTRTVMPTVRVPDFNMSTVSQAS